MEVFMLGGLPSFQTVLKTCILRMAPHGSSLEQLECYHGKTQLMCKVG